MAVTSYGVRDQRNPARITFGSGRVGSGARHVEIIDLPIERRTRQSSVGRLARTAVLRLSYKTRRYRAILPRNVTRAHLHATNIRKRNDGASKVGVRIEKKNENVGLWQKTIQYDVPSNREIQNQNHQSTGDVVDRQSRKRVCSFKSNYNNYLPSWTHIAKCDRVIYQFN